MVLYHAISTYQLLCVILHRIIFEKTNYSVLILPDFYALENINYMNMVRFGFFDEIYCFPYLKIKHDEKTMNKEVDEYFSYFLYDLSSFSQIYVAGTHFFFTQSLISRNIPFIMFEDAPGMYVKNDILYENICAKNPVQARFARENGLLNGKNKLIEKIYCVLGQGLEKEIVFCVNDWLKMLDKKQQKRVLAFWNVPKVRIAPKSTIVLTQQFEGLGKMTYIQQQEVYEEVCRLCQKFGKVYLKKHPNDKVEYRLPKDVIIIPSNIPIEVLRYGFSRKPKYMVSLSSTAMLDMNECCECCITLLQDIQVEANDEYNSIKKINEMINEGGYNSYVEFYEKEGNGSKT